MKKKRLYMKPAMQVYELQKHAPLICTSGGEYPQWNPENI